jgi:hypothetical protein
LTWKKVKMCVAGALTLPVGLPVALVALPIVFIHQGLPHLRKTHLNKVTDRLAASQGLHTGRDGKCARQVAKILTCIGHPDLAQICNGCRRVVESWAAEAGQQVNAGNVAPISDAELRNYMTEVAAHHADSYVF